jgi:hypothetical protein
VTDQRPVFLYGEDIAQEVFLFAGQIQAQRIEGRNALELFL